MVAREVKSFLRCFFNLQVRLYFDKNIIHNDENMILQYYNH